MTVYTGPIATAMRLITKYGKVAQLVQLDVPVRDDTVDADKPWEPGRVDLDEQVTMDAPMVFLDFEKKVIDGENIRKDDRMVLVAAGHLDFDLCNSVNPLTWGLREIDLGTRWSIVDVDLLAPGTENVLLTLQVRR